jgi:hypothetical protein
MLAAAPAPAVAAACASAVVQPCGSLPSAVAPQCAHAAAAAGLCGAVCSLQEAIASPSVACTWFGAKGELPLQYTHANV